MLVCDDRVRERWFVPLALAALLIGAPLLTLTAYGQHQEGDLADAAQTCDPVLDLLSEAESALGSLSDAEEDLVEATERGVWYEPAYGMQAEIRGALLAWLLSDPSAASILPPAGIRIRDVTIHGDILLPQPSIGASLHIVRAVFEGPATVAGLFQSLFLEKAIASDGLILRDLVVEKDVELRSLQCSGSILIEDAQIGGSLRLSGNLSGSLPEGDLIDKPNDGKKAAAPIPPVLVLHAVAIDESMVLTDLEVSLPVPGRTTSTTLIRMVDVGIAGDLAARSVSLVNETPYDLYARGIALEMEHVRIGKDVCFQDGFRADGAVRIRGSTIDGGLLLRDGSLLFPHESHSSLRVENTTIGGDVVLDGLHAEGHIRLVNGRIGGNVTAGVGSSRSAKLKHLLLDHAQIAGSVELGPLLTECRLVGLDGARIGGSLGLQGTFKETEGVSLRARGLRVQGDVFLGEIMGRSSELQVGSKYEGRVDFSEARIDGTLSVEHALWGDAHLVLSGATLGCLDRLPKGAAYDEGYEWPSGGNLSLTGLMYGGVGPWPSEGPQVGLLLEWLRLQLEADVLSGKRLLRGAQSFQQQPYDQLARLLDASGYPSIAREILVWKNRDIASFADLSLPQQLWYFVFGPLIGFGYEPHRAGLLAIGLVAVGALVFGYAHRKGYMVLAKPQDKPGPRQFSALMYAVDVTLPIINFRQAGHWVLNAKDMRRWRLFGWPVRVVLVLRAYVWLSIALGWLFTTLLVAGLSGLLRT